MAKLKAKGPPMIGGLHVIYLPVNQAWALMWHTQLLGIYNTKAEANEEMRDLLRGTQAGAGLGARPRPTPRPAGSPAARLDAFTRQYVETALWSSMDEEGRPLDDQYGIDDLAPETLAQMVVDSDDFQRAHWDDISMDPEKAGHDFWLTRQRTGAGFWDGDWPEPQASRLTDAARAYGEVFLYVGDDGQVHASPG